jgi:hypothetical protein
MPIATFYSPGTFVAETNKIEVASVEEAVKEAESIIQRYNARPYSFELEGKHYFLGGQHGRFFTVDEIKANNDPKDEILIWNMETNGCARVYQTLQGWKFTVPVPDDAVLVGN